jgi:hypothetical protein
MAILLFKMITEGNGSAEYAVGMVEKVCVGHFRVTLVVVWVV